MSEENIISKTDHPVTLDEISQGLTKLDINPGDLLLVHSSLSSLGWVCGGAQTVISALMRVLERKGTLVMPAHSGDLGDPAEWENPPVPECWLESIYENLPAFDPARTPTRGMGRIAELFRTAPNSIRSNHPQVSFTANGRLSKKIVVDHVLSPQLGAKSPLGKMYDLGAKVLLLGVEYDSCTCFHLAETLIPDMPKKRMGAPVFEKGKRVWKWFDDYDYNIEDFNLIGQGLEEEGFVKRYKIANAECRVFGFKEGVDFSRHWLLKHRFST